MIIILFLDERLIMSCATGHIDIGQTSSLHDCMKFEAYDCVCQWTIHFTHELLPYFTISEIGNVNYTILMNKEYVLLWSRMNVFAFGLLLGILQWFFQLLWKTKKITHKFLVVFMFISQYIWKLIVNKEMLWSKYLQCFMSERIGGGNALATAF